MQKEVKQIGNIYGFDGGNYAGNVYEKDGLCPVIRANSGGNTQPMIIVPDPAGGYYECLSRQIICEQRSDEGIRFFQDGCCGTIRTTDGGGDKRVIEQIIVASRGRNPNNPSDRTTGAPTEQRLEPNLDGVSNTITTVQKDNYVLEIRNGVDADE